MVPIIRIPIKCNKYFTSIVWHLIRKDTKRRFELDIFKRYESVYRVELLELYRSREFVRG